MRKAQSGIGNLILFISVILVAAIAAGVLIQTSGSLQSKVLSTGQRAQAQVSTALSVIDVIGNGSSSKIGEIYVRLKLAPGSDGMQLNDTLVTLDLVDGTQSYEFNTTQEISECNSAGLTDKYNVKYLINGTNHKDGYLQPGDVAELCFIPPSRIAEGKDVRVHVSPKRGTAARVEFKTPDLIVRDRVQMHP